MSSNAFQHYVPVREDWLARRTEEALDPALPIVDLASARPVIVGALAKVLQDATWP